MNQSVELPTDFTTAAPDLIRELLSKSPISMPPWNVAHFFESEHNIKEEYLDKSLDTLAEILPEFEEKNKDMIEELRKITLLAVPMFRKLQLMTILAIIRECVSDTDSFPFHPDFPKPPAANILNHIFPDRAAEACTADYEKIARHTPALLRHLVSWRNEVVNYTEGIEKFLEEYDVELSDDQKKHARVLIDRAKNTITQIQQKIALKEQQKEDEGIEYISFFKVLRREPKYAKLTPPVARAEIQRVYYELDVDIRSIIARQGEEGPTDSEEDALGTRSMRKRTRPITIDQLIAENSYSATYAPRKKPAAS